MDIFGFSLVFPFLTSYRNTRVGIQLHEISRAIILTTVSDKFNGLNGVKRIIRYECHKFTMWLSF